MKRVFFLLALFTTVFIFQASAQQGDPAAQLQRYKERVKPQLVAKAKLTEAEAEKVAVISFNYRSEYRGLKELSDAERNKRMDEIQAAQNKEFAAIPLTEEKIKAVNEFFEEQRKAMKQRAKANK